MARSGSSHTSELLDSHQEMRSHHGLFNDGPFGRWPADEFIDKEMMPYYSAILDENYQRTGGMEHSGEFLDKYIFTDDLRFNTGEWYCIGFKIQYTHFVHMPDLRRYLIDNEDIRIILNNRRNLVEHATAELWCQNGNSRGSRPGQLYEFGSTEPITVSPEDFFATCANLCRYREDAMTTFNQPERRFLEWSLEDMFDAAGGLNIPNHERLFAFLDARPSADFYANFTKTPRPTARKYLNNYDELKEAAPDWHGGVFSKYFADDYDPYRDREWPVRKEFQLDTIMVERDNARFRKTG